MVFYKYVCDLQVPTHLSYVYEIQLSITKAKISTEIPKGLQLDLGCKS